MPLECQSCLLGWASSVPLLFEKVLERKLETRRHACNQDSTFSPFSFHILGVAKFRHRLRREGHFFGFCPFLFKGFVVFQGGFCGFGGFGFLHPQHHLGNWLFGFCGFCRVFAAFVAFAFASSSSISFGGFFLILRLLFLCLWQGCCGLACRFLLNQLHRIVAPIVRDSTPC